jgi:predicted nucleic acid-binding protein
VVPEPSFWHARDPARPSTDAWYVALAERLNTELVPAGERLVAATAVPGRPQSMVK